MPQEQFLNFSAGLSAGKKFARIRKLLPARRVICVSGTYSCAPMQALMLHRSRYLRHIVGMPVFRHFFFSFK